MNEINNSIVEQYVKYVSDIIGKCDKMGNLIDELEGAVTPQRLNTALAMYFDISSWLIAEYQRQKIVYEAEKREFDLWKDEIFEQAKRQVIYDYAETKVKPSVTEFETRARTSHKDEYESRLASVETSEARMRFLLRMTELMKSYDSILTTLSSNMRQEMRSLSLDMRMNSTPQGVSANKVRTGGFPTRTKVQEDL